MNEIPQKPFIIGCDEVGYGAWAGPLVVVGIRAPREWAIEGLNDSKKLSAKKRETMSGKLERLIISGDITWGMAERSNAIIDQMGLGVALKDAYVEIFQQLYRDDCLIISDGNLKFDNPVVDAYDKVSEPKADGKYAQVMAASIIAKHYRDSKMHLLHKQFPMYGWDHNVGYYSDDHMDGLKQHGPCRLHRHSYAPIKKLLNLSLF